MRRRALASLFLICAPRGDDLAAALAVYLDAAEDLDAEHYAEAVQSMIKDWESPWAPTPGQIRKRVGRVAGYHRAEERRRFEQAEWAEQSRRHQDFLADRRRKQLAEGGSDHE